MPRSLKPKHCQLCKEQVDRVTAIRLRRDDEVHVWLCVPCFDKPVEDVFFCYPTRQDSTRHDPTGQDLTRQDKNYIR